MHFRRQRDILLTLQERRSRLTLARRLHSKDAEVAAEAIAGELGGLPARARRTITHDNGGEFARHEAVTDAIGLHAYFCDPHAPPIPLCEPLRVRVQFKFLDFNSMAL